MLDLKHSPSALINFYISPYEALVRKYINDVDKNYGFEDPEDPFLKIIASKGIDHESSIIQEYKNLGLSVGLIVGKERKGILDETLAFMHQGIDVIYQGALANKTFFGRPDFLIKKEGLSNLGEYTYEIVDAKLSKSIKSEHILQLCCYADMLRDHLGSYPECASIITGDHLKHKINLNEFSEYYKFIKDSFLKFNARECIEPPNPAEYSSWGKFTEHALLKLKEDDSLNQISDIRASQIAKFNSVGIKSVSDLLSDSAQKPKKIDQKTFDRIRLQARLQIESRKKDTLQFELINNNDRGLGLFLLPKKSKLDVYFDLESNPLYSDFVLHYLWGAAFEEDENKFRCWWAHDKTEMQSAFCKFIDWVYERWMSDKTMHIYHYGHFEISTLKSLMGSFGLNETKIDNLLRNGVFVDLYKIIRQSLCIGAEGYGLKALEPIFRNVRLNEVKSGQDSTVQYEAWMSNPDGFDHADSKILSEIWKYNKEDCESLIQLADWLRNIQITQKIEPHEALRDDLSDEKNDIEKILSELLNECSDKISKNRGDLLANLSLYHKRENKPVFWRLFDRLSSTDEELEDDLDSFGSLTATGKIIDITSRSRGFEYTFNPNQDTKLKQGDQARVAQDENLTVTIHRLDIETSSCILKSTATELPNFLSLVPFKVVNPGVIEDSIRSIAKNYLQKGIISPCLDNFLSKSSPRLKISGPEDLSQWGQDTVEAATNIATNLDEGYLCIQGPPGTGKSFTGSKVIASLVQQGYCVGIASNSHKAIDNLLENVVEDLDDQSINGDICRINREDDDFYNSSPRIHRVNSASEVNLANKYEIYGGTAWCFSNPTFDNVLDYLFIDEAGQVSLANVVGMSASTRNLILMGDQMQLSQPTLGTHPGESGTSSLEYLLGKNKTIDQSKGLLLPLSFRLHPKICNFVSQNVYEGRISAIEKNKSRFIEPRSKSKYLEASGIKYIEVEHFGNEQSSIEEINTIKEIIDEARKSRKKGFDNDKINDSDILIISPYNHQTRLLQDELGPSFQIGTVDKFQGRQAPIVIVSMASSDVDSSPRGAEFLFDINRLNVAVTRAQCLAIVVASKNLLNLRYLQPNNMRLHNFYLNLING